MELSHNQSALILEIDDQGEISINVASGDMEGLTAALCQVLAAKLTEDEAFQEELMGMLEFEDEDE
ncbi:MAG: twitching motility protein [Thermodesulfobacteriota bacterium]